MLLAFLADTFSASSPNLRCERRKGDAARRLTSFARSACGVLSTGSGEAALGHCAIAAIVSAVLKTFAMEVDYRSFNSDINTIYLSSYLGFGEAAGHRCDRHCEVQHVWANLYRCATSGSSHVCDQNCNQRIMYDNHSTLCRVSGKVFPLTISEQDAIRGVRRKRDAENSETSPMKRCRDMMKNPPCFESPFRQRVLPISTFMDIN